MWILLLQPVILEIYYHKYCAFICALYGYMARTTSTTTKPLIKQTECDLTTCQHAVEVRPPVQHTWMDVYRNINTL